MAEGFAEAFFEGGIVVGIHLAVVGFEGIEEFGDEQPLLTDRPGLSLLGQAKT